MYMCVIYMHTSGSHTVYYNIYFVAFCLTNECHIAWQPL